MPDDLTPWERILDFRNDPLTKGYLIGLRTWMADVARQNLSAIEAEQKLEWLMFQQAQHLRVHKITANSRSFGAVFVAAVEVLENLLKIKWGKAAQGIISIMDGQTELLKSEISGPAKEVNYLIKAKQTFG
jgi:hypothetical protein